MKISNLNSFCYDTESNTFGLIEEVNFKNQTVTMKIEVDKGSNHVSSFITTMVAKLANVEVLEKIGMIGDTEVIDKDVLITPEGTMYLLKYNSEDKSIDIHILDDDLKYQHGGLSFRVRSFSELIQDGLEVYGNHYELLNQLELEKQEKALVDTDFNIKIMRSNVDGEFKYFYACNNTVEDEVDLIKVVFIGHKLLEEAYTRDTVNIETYIEMVTDGILVEASPQELMNYATGMTYQTNQTNQDSSRCNDCDCEDGNACDDVDELCDDDNYCEFCDQRHEDCECSDW